MDLLKIKPVFVSYERGFFRSLPSRESLEKEVEKRYSKLKKEFPEVVFLKPSLVTSYRDLEVLREELTYSTDAILVERLGGIAHKIMADIGLIGPPLIMVGGGVLNHDIVAYLRARGVEAHAPIDENDLRKLFRRLAVRKKMRLTRVLVVSSKALPSFSALSSAYNLDLMKLKLGVDYEWISSEELLSQMTSVSDDKAREIVNKLASQASKIKVDEENLLRSIKLYIALKELMTKYYCNAVTVDCAEPIYYEYRVTPCLAFTLLKDEKIPASCEADLSALIAMAMLMYISEKPAFMGNLWLHSAENDLMRYSHDVPPTKIFGERVEHYELHDFHNKGYGATVYVEVPPKTDITLARVNSYFTKILIIKGTIESSLEGAGCRETLEVNVRNAVELTKKISWYGHHFSAVLGDYTRELSEVAELMGISVELHL
ncbi:MAG: hypothetical protein DRJ52_04500 [Thermoprotei archaeon]|nr:MAG: hypothetical protein DRJ52_04500 [Thermoprotei archaeon]